MSMDPTHDYYETHANEYFQMTHQAHLDHLWAKLGRNVQPNAIILDVGCGSGRDMRHFARQGFRVVGIDYALNMLKLAQSFSQQPVALGNIVYLPFKPHTFDAVWAIGSLLHVPRHQLPAALAQIYSVLKPGATFFSAMKRGRGEGLDSRGRYHVLYLPDEWAQILTEQGYEVIEIEERSEFREVEPGNVQEIVWVECLARAALKVISSQHTYSYFAAGVSRESCGGSGLFQGSRFPHGTRSEA